MQRNSPKAQCHLTNQSLLILRLPGGSGEGVLMVDTVLTALMENAYNNVQLKLLCDYTFMTVGTKVSLHPSFYN